VIGQSRLPRRGAAVLIAAVALALAGAACGSDDETTDTAPAARTETTQAEPTTTEITEGTTTEGEGGDDSGGSGPEEETESEGGDDSGGVSGSGGGDPTKPDSPENDVAPEPGTPQEAFEQFCDENPEACG